MYVGHFGNFNSFGGRSFVVLAIKQEFPTQFVNGVFKSCFGFVQKNHQCGSSCSNISSAISRDKGRKFGCFGSTKCIGFPGNLKKRKEDSLYTIVQTQVVFCFKRKKRRHFRSEKSNPRCFSIQS